MKFTFDWLKDHLDTNHPLSSIVETLSMIGLEVESVEDRGERLQSFKVGKVISTKKHPSADRLQLCLVDYGDGEPVQVVCGAPNVRPGLKGIFAPPGTFIPGIDLTLKKSKIRGEDSNGMLLSEREMGISDDHEGIVDLKNDPAIGTPAPLAMGLSDPVIDVALTPNRQDCSGVRGIARDLAAAGMGKLKPSDTKRFDGTFQSPIKWKRNFTNETEDACPLVVGRYFRNLNNGSSPSWLKERLRAIGLRPISALVDITNYITFDQARPLHVFDAKLLSGNLTMRLARPGEKVAALDGEEYLLDQTMTVIADDNGVQAIGGIMGGSASGVSEKTTDVFLEVALFDEVRTATTGRKLGIMSDARYRFERGVDPQSADWGVHVATEMIHTICGGENSLISTAGEIPASKRIVNLRKKRIWDLGGVKVPPKKQFKILTDLGFDPVDEGESLRTTPPPWRQDIDGEADIVEEVLRIHGYEKIPVVPLRREQTVASSAWSVLKRRELAARRILAARGMTEAVTFSFMKRETADLFGFSAAGLVIDNPISADLDVMRPSILPNLLDAARRNEDRGNTDIALFELGPEYASDDVEGQTVVAAGVRSSINSSRHWSIKPRGADAWDAKADTLSALEAAGAPVDKLQLTTDAPSWFHPGRSGVFRLGSAVLATFGDLHPAVLGAMDLQNSYVGFSVNIEHVPVPKKKRAAARPLLNLSPFQAVHRDFAFVVDEEVNAEDVVRAARAADKKLVGAVTVFDVYEGDRVGDGKKSIAISVVLQPVEATLTDQQISMVSEKITGGVNKRTGGTLRD